RREREVGERQAAGHEGSPDQCPAHDRAHGPADRSGGRRDELHGQHPERGDSLAPWPNRGNPRRPVGPATAPDPTGPPSVAGRLHEPGPPYHCPRSRTTAILAQRPGPSPAVEASCVRIGTRRERRATVRWTGSVAAALLFVLAIALPALAAQGPTRLSDASVSPRSGTTAKTFTLAVTYKSQNDSPADFVKVKIGSSTYAMSRATAADWKRGVRYTWS